MGFRDVINQEETKKFLRNCVTSDRISHGYLLHGPRGVGKSTLALAFAQALNCQNNDPDGCGECPACKRIARFVHPDVTFIFPTSSRNETEEIVSTLKMRSENRLFIHTFPGAASIKIKTIQDLRMDLAMGVREGRRRVVILAYAERMNPEASNCLLRTLEEPAAGVTFVLTVTSRSAVLPTILSRCQVLYVAALPAEEIQRVLGEWKGLEEKEASLIARLSGGSLATALEFAEQGIVEYRRESLGYLSELGRKEPRQVLDAAENLAQTNDRNRVRMFVTLALTWLRDLLLVKCGGPDVEIANIDMLEALEREANAIELAELRRRIDILEEIVYSMEQNVDLSLLLSASFLRLAGIVKETGLPVGLRRPLDS